MATSSITKNFYITEPEQVEKFANAVEECYQESLTRKNNPCTSCRFAAKNDVQRIIDIWAKQR